MWCFEFLKFSPAPALGRRVWLLCWHLTQAGSKYFQMRYVYQPIIGRSLLKLVCVERREKSISISVSHDNFLCVSGYRVSLLSASPVCQSPCSAWMWCEQLAASLYPVQTQLLSPNSRHICTTADQHQSWIVPFSLVLLSSQVPVMARQCCNGWLE